MFKIKATLGELSPAVPQKLEEGDIFEYTSDFFGGKKFDYLILSKLGNTWECLILWDSDSSRCLRDGISDRLNPEYPRISTFSAKNAPDGSIRLSPRSYTIGN